MSQYVEASPRAKLVFYLAAIALGGIGIFLFRFNAWFPVHGSPEEQLRQMADRAMYVMIALVVMYGALACLVLILAIGTVRTRQWPPAGLPMPFRMAVTEIKRPFAVWAPVAVVLVLYVTHAALSINSWRQTDRLVQSLMQQVQSSGNANAAAPGPAKQAGH
jgi:hypothetical protein